MTNILHRSIEVPIRQTSYDQKWNGPDKGLIWCWERGREKRGEDPELAMQAEKGELVMLNWKGGVDRKLTLDEKPGTLQYLAMWQGLRAADLHVRLDEKNFVTCSKFNQVVAFSESVPLEEVE